MILQRDRPVKIWGKGRIGEEVRVQFADQEQRTRVAADGTWSVLLSALRACATPRRLSISASNTLQYDDVLVGEVWLCSGQSNMEKQLGPRKGQKPTDNWEQDLASSDCPTLRLYQVPHGGVLKAPLVGLCWVPSTPENLKATEFSAAAWYFGRELSRVLGVPVGLIHASVGGTRIEPWIPREAFARVSSLSSFSEAAAGTKVDGVTPSSLYNSMIAPVAPYALRGFLWYQGESNCGNADTWIYADKMRALIEGWREIWQDAEAPFYYVYLAPWLYTKRGQRAHMLTELALPMFWEAQIKPLDLPHTGLVPTSDISPDVTDIHPTNKRDVGLRLAHLALSHTYQLEQGLVDPPRFGQLISEQAGFRVDFRNAEGGLLTNDGQPPNAFSIAGADQVFHPATAVIAGSSVILSSAEVKRPVAVRHAFHETARPNLVNKAGLPALAFRTDTWDVVVEHAPAPLSRGRVLWFGDSITQTGHYVTFALYYLARAFPHEKFDIISIGRSSETLSGLSEKTHTGPRPCALDRLPRALELVTPAIVVACYGMNDGIYHPSSPERLTAFQVGVKRFLDTCRASGAKVVLLTPPPFDRVPGRAFPTRTVAALLVTEPKLLLTTTV